MLFDETFINVIEDLKKLAPMKDLKTAIVYKSFKINENEIEDFIEMSTVIVFVITNNYLKTERLRYELEFAKKQLKPVIFIIIEKIESILLNNNKCELNFKQLNFFDLCNSDNKCNLEKLFISLVRSLINQDLDDVKNITDKRVKSDFLWISNSFFDDYENNRIIQFFQDSTDDMDHLHLSVFNRDTFKLIKEIEILDIRSQIEGLCYNKYLNRYCLLLCNELYIMDSDFQSLTYKNSFKFKICDKFIGYEEISQNIYLASFDAKYDAYDAYDANFIDEMVFTIHVYDKNLVFIRDIKPEGSNPLSGDIVTKLDYFSIKLINNLLYVNSEHVIFVYDSEVKLIKKIEMPFEFCIHKLFSDPKIRNYAFCISTSNELRIFNTFNYKFYGLKYVINKMGFQYEMFCVINKYLITGRDIFHVEVHDIGLIIGESFDCCNVNRYICKIASNRQHLLMDPYLLPCGNLACLECIYGNFDIYRNYFFCFACNVEHNISNNEFKRSAIIEDNLKSICNDQIKTLKELVKQSSIVNV
jgi:hypothetical protein